MSFSELLINSFNEIEKELNLDKRKIWCSCNSNYLSVGYKWEYYENIKRFIKNGGKLKENYLEDSNYKYKNKNTIKYTT